jgi:periplasmic divalent cation tolerance protein
MPSYVQVLTTIDSLEGAERVARAVVEARAAACAQIVGPIHSTYWWNDAVETAEEWQVLMKTTEERYPELETAIRGAHSYDVPEIIATPITRGGKDYLSWVSKETASTV